MTLNDCDILVTGNVHILTETYIEVTADPADFVDVISRLLVGVSIWYETTVLVVTAQQGSPVFLCYKLTKF